MNTDNEVVSAVTLFHYNADLTSWVTEKPAHPKAADLPQLANASSYQLSLAQH